MSFFGGRDARNEGQEGGAFTYCDPNGGRGETVVGEFWGCSECGGILRRGDYNCPDCGDEIRNGPVPSAENGGSQTGSVEETPGGYF